MKPFQVPVVVLKVHILYNPVPTLETQLSPWRSSGGARSTISPENHGGRPPLWDLKIRSEMRHQLNEKRLKEIKSKDLDCILEVHQIQSQLRGALAHLRL